MIKAIKTAISIVLSVFIIFASVVLGTTTSNIQANAATDSYIDNSSLVTKWVPDAQVTLDENGWPTWVDDLVMAECRVETASTDGTFRGMEAALKHFAEMGVNGLWVTPIEDKGLDTVASTYCNYGVHTVNPYLTGQIPYGEPWHEVDYEISRKIVKEFVDMCHSYNIRVFFDKVPWGVSKKAPLYEENQAWFRGASEWGGYDWFLQHEDVYDYYYQSNMDFIMDTGCDGIRWDLEPEYFGYTIYEEMHNELLGKGRKVLFFSETYSFHGASFAFEQHGGVNGTGSSSQASSDLFFNEIDIVESITTGEFLGHSLLQMNGESGQYRHYVYQISSHDNLRYHDASLAEWAYEYLYGSFIPLFYMGEEWNHYYGGGSCYGATDINQFEKHLENPENRAYYEAVKELIGYKWKYKDIFNKTTQNHRETNICTVKVKGSNLVDGYARYAGTKAILVIPNVNEDTNKAIEMTVAVPFADMDLDNYSTYTVSDIRTGKVIVKGDAAKVASFKDTVEHNTCGLYMITAEGKIQTPTDTKNDTPNGDTDNDVAKNQSNDYDDYSNLDPDDEIADESEETEMTVKKGVKKYKTVDDGSGWPIWATIAIIAGAVVLIGGAVAFIFVRKRKN